MAIARGTVLTKSRGALGVALTADNGAQITVDNLLRDGVTNIVDLHYDGAVQSLAEIDALIVTMQAIPAPQRLKDHRGRLHVNDTADGGIAVEALGPAHVGVKRRVVLTLAGLQRARTDFAAALASLKNYAGR